MKTSNSWSSAWPQIGHMSVTIMTSNNQASSFVASGGWKPCVIVGWIAFDSQSTKKAMHHLLLASTLHVTDRYRSNQIPRSLEISKVFLSFFFVERINVRADGCASRVCPWPRTRWWRPSTRRLTFYSGPTPWFCCCVALPGKFVTSPQAVKNLSTNTWIIASVRRRPHRLCRPMEAGSLQLRERCWAPQT